MVYVSGGKVVEKRPLLHWKTLTEMVWAIPNMIHFFIASLFSTKSDRVEEKKAAKRGRRVSL